LVSKRLDKKDKGEGISICQDDRDLMHPVPYIMLWTGALME